MEVECPNKLNKKWKKNTIFPYRESQFFEFKNTSSLIVDLNNLKEKWTEIICGMLNSGGGWFIIGIDDTTNNITGINATRKDIDQFNLWVDSIYRSLVLSDGTPIHPQATSLKTYIFEIDNDDKVLIGLKVFYTHKKPNTYFQMSDGKRFFRLNGSTYKMSGEPIYKQSQIYQRDKENDCVIQKFQNELNKKKKEIITIELERRKLQSALDSEKNLRQIDNLNSQNQIRKAIKQTSDTLFLFYRGAEKQKMEKVSDIESANLSDEEKEDSQAKKKYIKLNRSFYCKSLIAIGCFASTYLWIASKIYLL